MTPRVSSGTPEWRPIFNFKSMTACALLKPAATSPKPFSITVTSVE